MQSEELVLSLLRLQKGYVSGKTLAKEIGISTSGITKRIKILRRFGYNIESRHRMGYRIADETNLPLPWELRNVLDTLFVGKDKIIYRLTTHSTQNLAISFAEENPSSDGIVVIAGQQKSGRGRQNRKWLSPKGGIWLSVVLRPRISISKITLLSFTAALAVCDAIKKTTELDAKLRWPNDVTISGKKIAGILIDMSMEAERINYAVVGIGINANVDSLGISSSLENDVKVTSLRDELGHDTNILELTKVVLERLEYYYLKLKRCASCTIIEEWKKNSDILHQKVALMQNNRIIEGIAVDVKNDGSLLVRTDDCDNINVVTSDIRVRY
ncbi:MAG: biotin--[acetyl-CoA-carboxylase] ligase [Thermoproteota archaeon]|jgi:BirA family biotin operon repressor/biotin-[acetyl-CoA-carboxylase] ligase|nr:biotin--[acetyl-CoA-carboxylase] ligase [Thermoproteota archaeon]